MPRAYTVVVDQHRLRVDNHRHGPHCAALASSDIDPNLAPHGAISVGVGLYGDQSTASVSKVDQTFRYLHAPGTARFTWQLRHLAVWETFLPASPILRQPPRVFARIECIPLEAEKRGYVGEPGVELGLGA